MRRSSSFYLRARSLSQVFAIALALVVLSACTKKPESMNSVIAFKVPSASAFQSKNALKNGQFETVPANRKMCFGVNVIADDLNQVPASACSPKMGVVAGFAEAGGLLQVEVPRGENRTFELYLYLQAEDDSSPCPTMDKKFSAAQLSRVYLMGSSKNVSIRNAIEDVSITATFPGIASTFAVSNSYAAVCTATPDLNSRPGFHVSNGQATATGGGLTLQGAVGGQSATVLTGGGMRIITK